MLAKLSASEKLVGLGGIAAIVGWLVGTLFATIGGETFGVGAYQYKSPTVNIFTWQNAGIFAILSLIVAIIVLVVLYLKNAPGMSINWPMPVTQILLGLAVALLACAALTFIMHMSNGTTGAPAMLWIADILLVGGGAVAAWGAYQGWVAAKK
jgi:hypothetical protein